MNNFAERIKYGIIRGMTDSLGQKAANVLTYILLAGIIAGGMLFMYPNYRRSQELKSKNAELEQEIELRKREIAQLQENQRRFNSDTDFVELIARRNHRVLPGELVFIFDKD